MAWSHGSSGLCPNCGVHSGFVMEGGSRVIWPKLSTGGNLPERPRVREVVFSCLHCKKSVVVHNLETQGEDGATTVQRVVVPEQSPRTLDEAIPSEVSELFGEAAVCEAAGALRAAGVMYRAAVEAIAKDQGHTSGNLYAKLEGLRGAGLSPEVVDDLHEARVLGNDSIHDGLEYSVDEVADVAELITEASVLIYVQPEQRRRMREARKARHDGRTAT